MWRGPSLPIRSSRAFSWGEPGRQKLRDYVVGLKEVPVEFDALAEPAREIIDGAGGELGAVDVKGQQQPSPRSYHPGEFGTCR
jgi:hypothetical protein